MSERPLLLFPTPQNADRTKAHGGSGNIHLPDITRQGQRLSPMFKQLQTAFAARRIELQQTTAGIDPEQVLVIETVGIVDNFIKAVQKFEGFEWMGELEIDEIAPDQDFFNKKDQQKELTGRLFMLMSNQRALDEMLSLWKRYEADQNMTFVRGLAKFCKIFRQLKNIRRWDVQDRLQDTGVIDAWLEDLKYDAERVVPFEAELWFRGNSQLRAISANRVADLVQQAGGRIVSQSVLENIAYHGLLAELPAQAIRAIVDNPETELIKCENVMFFRPVGQMVVEKKVPEGEMEHIEVKEQPLPEGNPVVALLDGLPQANHHLLAGRLIVDDPDKWEEEYAAAERIHGSSMASLIIHGDLNQPQPALARHLYTRPIMKPLNWPNKPRPEGIPEDCLPVDLIHRAVKRLFEGEQGEEPVAPQIKVINLSIGDRARQFTQSMSPLARLLDWLSVKYGVLFIVSAGNHADAISLQISRSEFDSLSSAELEAATVKALYSDARHRKLLSPAETMNGLSVGALHLDQAQVTYKADRLDLFEHLLPSPVSAFGSGYRRAIKPDLIYGGGRQWYRLPLQRTEPPTIEPAIFRSPPGNKVAAPGALPGELNATSYCCGTSNATALISRAAGICFDALQQIFYDQEIDIDLSAYIAPLLKAMLVHGCSWNEIGSHIAKILQSSEKGSQISGLVSRWMGYGVPTIERVLECTEQRATVLGFGQLSDGEAHVFNFPLPPSLGARPEWRRLTVTLAWLSPISANTQKYRTASLWFELEGFKPATNRKESCGGQNSWRTVRKGTVQHEVFEAKTAEPFVDGNILNIKVNCREEAGTIESPVAYGLFVSLEVAEGLDIAIYSEIRTRIAQQIEINKQQIKVEGN